jgi:signal transduction histidine kinase
VPQDVDDATRDEDRPLYGSHRQPQTHPVETRRAVDGRSRRGLLLVAAAGILVGLVAEAVYFGLADPARWIPDLIVGWTCIGCGSLATSRRPGSRIGPLITAAGFTWFIGNFSTVAVAPLAILANQLTLLHRAVLLHATLTLPTGRTDWWLQRGVIVAGYCAWSIFAMAGSVLVTAGLSVAVVAVALARLHAGPAPTRTTRLVALAAATLLSMAFTVGSVVHAMVPSGASDQFALLFDEATIVVVALGLVAATLRPEFAVGRTTDLMVEVARRRAGHVRDALATALGDPSLEVGYWHPPSGTYLDSSGEPVVPPGARDPRTSTRVDASGQPIAVLVHDPAVLESSALSAAIGTTATLAAANVRLRGDVLDQLADLRASRQRLILAEDGERHRLERQLHDGPMRRAHGLAATLDEMVLVATENGESDVAEHLRQARIALADVEADLERLAQGLHPVALSAGLAAALRSLADRSSLHVQLSGGVGEIPQPIELAVYYACAEAIANAAKHARATRVSVRVGSSDAEVWLTVTDDGAGGADPATGTGLRGIQDRIEALGGRVAIRSEAGVGTRLRAEIPLPVPSDGAVVRSDRPSEAPVTSRP